MILYKLKSHPDLCDMTWWHLVSVHVLHNSLINFYRCHHNPNSKCIHCVPLEVGFIGDKMLRSVIMWNLSDGLTTALSSFSLMMKSIWRTINLQSNICHFMPFSRRWDKAQRGGYFLCLICYLYKNISKLEIFSLCPTFISVLLKEIMPWNNLWYITKGRM